MIKTTRAIIFITLFGLTAFVSADESQWNISDLGTLTTFYDAYVKEFNDQGQVLIAGRPNNSKTKGCSWAFRDSQLGIIHIKAPWEGIIPYSWHKVNNQGVVIGLSNFKNGGEYVTEVITWQPENGCNRYKLPLKRDAPSEAFIARCRSSERIVISSMKSPELGQSYDAKVFVLLNDKIVELTPSLVVAASQLGYDAGDWVVIAVNSQGMMFGRFDYYGKHPCKPGKFAIGTKYFLWDHNEMVLIENPVELFAGRDSNTDVNQIFLDSYGRVLFDVHVENLRFKQSWLWSKEEGLTRLYPEQCLGMAPGRGWAHAIGLLDDGTFLWTINNYSEFNGFVFQKENKQVRLPLDYYRQPLSEYKEKFPGIKIVVQDVLEGTWRLRDKFNQKPTFGDGGHCNGNSKRQMFCIGKIFGEHHPFLIEQTED